MELKIYSSAGDLKMTVAPSAQDRATGAIGEEHLLSLSFTAFECTALEVYDYVDFEGFRYWVLERYLPTMNTRNEWAYSLQLHGVEGLAAQTLIVNPTDGKDDPLVMLTAPAREHAALIVDNLNRRMNTTIWKVGEVVVSEYIHIDYTGMYASDALAEVVEAADTEWWFDGTTLNFSRCEFGALVELAYGNGLIGGISRSVADGVKFFTRLFPVGSTRNIDPDKYGHARLQLPGGETFVEQDTFLGIVEHYEQEAFAEIYPRRIGIVGAVRSVEKTGEDGKPFTIWHFTDPSIPFNPNEYEIGGLVKQVTFQSGELRGRTFEVNYDDERKEFEIITQWPYDDTQQLPQPPLVPVTGDEYVLCNIAMPESYYAAAEQEFREAVDAFLAEARKDLSVFTAQTDFTVVQQRSLDLKPGQRIRLYNDELFPDAGYRDTRITSVSRSVVNPGEMTISMSDVLSVGRISRIENELGAVTQLTRSISSELPDIIRSWEETPPSDSSIYSALKSVREFLNKRTGGTVEGPIVVDEIRSSDFAGDAGYRILKDANGDSVLVIDKIDVRKEAKFNDLVINQISFSRGENIFTAGGFEIVRVEEPAETDIYRCYYDTADGRRRAGIVVGDQVRCQRYDDAFGAIVKYYWRVAVAVGDDYVDLSKSDCDGSGVPAVGDNCVQFGNRSDKTRQAAIVLDPHNGGRIEIYNGIDSYTLSEKNRAGMGTDPATGEAYLYGFGDFFVGDRDTEADDATFVSFRKLPGETRRRVHIRGALRIAAGSSGLENLSEWAAKQQQIDSFDYLKKALANDTEVVGGLIQSSTLRLGYKDPETGRWIPKSGTNGIYDPARIGGGIAAWYGGDMIDMSDYYIWNADTLQWVLKEGVTPPTNIAQGVDRMDGTGYRAFGNFWWDASGKVYASPNSFFVGEDTVGNLMSLFHLNYKQGTTDTSDFNNVVSFFALRPMTVLKVNSYIDLGEARIAWDGANHAVKISNPNGTDKVNLYATGGISALGLGADGGGSGGGGASALADLLDVSLSSPAVDNVLVFDGTHWVNRPMSAIKPDLSAYATQPWVKNQGYITASALVGYATEQWVIGRGYATPADIDARIDQLVDGAPAAFDTLKEIADVLQSNVNSIGDIMTALGNKADKATTLAGYGIADAYTASQVNSLLAAYLPLAGGTMANTSLVKNLNADLLDGFHASTLLTSLSNDANQNLTITIGGTKKSLRVAAVGGFETAEFVKPDNGGYPAYVLIADVTNWFTTGTISAEYGIVGVVYSTRNGGLYSNTIQKVYARVAYNKNYYKLETDDRKSLIPRIVSYDGKYYLALYLTGSGCTHSFIGSKRNLLSSFITIPCSSSTGVIDGLTVIHDCTGMSHFGTSTSSLDASKLGGKNAEEYVTTDTQQTITGGKTIESVYANALTLRRKSESGGAFIDYYANNSTTVYWRVGVRADNRFGFAWGDVLTNANIDNKGNISATSFIKVGGDNTQVLIANGTSKTLKMRSSVGTCDWTSLDDADSKIPTMSMMAYWDGRYNLSASNLAYCRYGAFGDIVTQSASHFATAAALTSLADTVNKKLDQSVFNDLFEKVNVGTAAAPKYVIRAKYSIESVGGVTALKVE